MIGQTCPCILTRCLRDQKSQWVVVSHNKEYRCVNAWCISTSWQIQLEKCSIFDVILVIEPYLQGIFSFMGESMPNLLPTVVECGSIWRVSFLWPMEGDHLTQTQSNYWYTCKWDWYSGDYRLTYIGRIPNKRQNVSILHEGQDDIRHVGVTDDTDTNQR